MKKTILLTSAVFTNDKKTEKHPDFTRKVDTLMGTMQIAIWKQKSTNGMEYLNLEISKIEKDELPTT